MVARSDGQADGRTSQANRTGDGSVDAMFSIRRGLPGVRDEAMLRYIDKFDELLRYQREAEARGIHGTLLGVAAIAVLNNGLVHARLPREAAGLLTGALLLLALSAGPLLQQFRARRAHSKVITTPANPAPPT